MLDNVELSKIEFISLLVILGVILLVVAWFLFLDIKQPKMEVTSCELVSANGNFTVVLDLLVINNDAAERKMQVTGIIEPGNSSQQLLLDFSPFEVKTVKFQYPSSKEFRGTCSSDIQIILRKSDIRKYLVSYSYSSRTATITNNLACPTSCDDLNLCTKDYCSSDTNYSCVSELITSNESNCGQTSGCFYSSCVSGNCVSNTRTRCCGNDICEINEDFFNCPGDCNNSVSVKCSNQNVILPSQTRSGLGIANCILTNNNPDNVSLSVNSQVVNWSGTFSKDVQLKPNQKYTVLIDYPFDQDFYFNDVVRDATINFSVLQKNNEIYAQASAVKIGAKGDIDWTEPQVAYAVTPQDPCIEYILSKAKNKMSGKALFGYQGTEEDVKAQARAIYDTLHELGFSYVSSSITFTPGVVQRVRLPYESVRDKSGNCADGSLLFASIFENLDMEPIIITVPGHAFVALRTSPDSKEAIFIETTMVGTNSYDKAISAAAKEYADNYNVTYTYAYDIKSLRKMGYLPRPSFSSSCNT